MQLHLIDRRLYFDVSLEINEAIGVEVAHADGSYLTFTIRTLHSSVRAIVIAERLMDQE